MHTLGTQSRNSHACVGTGRASYSSSKLAVLQFIFKMCSFKVRVPQFTSCHSSCELQLQLPWLGLQHLCLCYILQWPMVDWKNATHGHQLPIFCLQPTSRWHWMDDVQMTPTLVSSLFSYMYLSPSLPFFHFPSFLSLYSLLLPPDSSSLSLTSRHFT